MLRTIAMYLPQFHRVKENDEWWGEGFTEWTAVKSAEKLTADHIQPRVPLNDNYYDLTDCNALRWQAELAKKYLVDGFCFYHYYFENGRKILEKPAELLLAHPEIDMNYCFCWANESWVSSWSKIEKEGCCWSSIHNVKRDNRILLNQNYGEKEDWKKHFEYLLPFFCDSRYLREDNKPIFMFYRYESMSCLEEMISYWQELARDNGLEGIYIIVCDMANNPLGGEDIADLKGIDAVYFKGPSKFWDEWSKMNCGDYERAKAVYDYCSTYQNAIKRPPLKGIKTIFGAFTDFDDSPRRGVNGRRFHRVNVDDFRDKFIELGIKNIFLGNDLYFINAWNEWGEGMYLEPDQDNKYGFLEAVKDSMILLNDREYVEKRIKNLQYDTEPCCRLEIKKYRSRMSNYKLMMSLLELFEKGISIEELFLNKGYRNVAIYGFGVIGKKLLSYIEKSNQLVLSDILDKNEKEINCGQKTKKPGDDLDNTDIIVITINYDYEMIVKKLRKHYTCDVVSLEELLNE